MSAENKEAPKGFQAMLLSAEMPLSIAGFAGILFKVMNSPGANLLLLLTMSSLSIMYIFSTLTVSMGPTATATDKIINKLNGMGCSVSLMGLLFLFMVWPGSMAMLLTGAALLLVTLLYMINAKTKEAGSPLWTSRVMYRTAGILLLSTVLFLLRLNFLR